MLIIGRKMNREKSRTQVIYETVLNLSTQFTYLEKQIEIQNKKLELHQKEIENTKSRLSKIETKNRIEKENLEKTIKIASTIISFLLLSLMILQFII